MEKLPLTPSQTVGPFFAYCLTAEQYRYNFNSLLTQKLLPDDVEAERIRVFGQIFDGAGNPIHDAMIEIWQADQNGLYRTETINKNDHGFIGLGRMGTGTTENYSYSFTTVRPGSVGENAPHINISIFMRGSLHRLITRMYFADEENDKDPLLLQVESSRKKTLIAQKIIAGSEVHYLFNINMQGEKETVFFKM